MGIHLRPKSDKSGDFAAMLRKIRLRLAYGEQAAAGNLRQRV
jgi:hypothetical protein